MKLDEAIILNDRLAGRARLMSAVGMLFLTMSFVGSLIYLFFLEEKISQMTQKVQLLQSQHTTLVQENAQLQKQSEHLKKVNKLVDEAIHLDANRDFTNSILKLDKVLQEYPSDEIALYWEAHAYYRLNDYPKSVDLALKTLSTDRDYFDPWVVLILASYKEGQISYAERYINMIINARIENYSSLFSRTTEWPMLWRAYKHDFSVHEDKLRAIQSNLKRLGYYNGKIDAQIGRDTEDAVESFYTENHISNEMSVNDLLNTLSKIPHR